MDILMLETCTANISEIKTNLHQVGF
jgi:hypothetical protein